MSNSCNTGSEKSSYTGTFSQRDLVDLNKGDYKISPGGCVQNSINPDCKRLIPLDNGEYIANGAGPGCNMCSAYYGAEKGVVAGNGTTECCSTGGIPIVGSKCQVQRVAFNGDPVSCCLKSTSSVLYPQLTGNSIVQGDPSGYWSKIDGDENYTCSTDSLFSCSTNEMSGQIASICGNFPPAIQKSVVRAWQKGKPIDKIDPTGYCYNYVVNSGDRAASTNVLNNGITSLVNSITLNNPKRGINNIVNNSNNIENMTNDQAVVFSNMLELCQNGSVAGVCDGSLTGVCSEYTRDEIFGFYKKYLELSVSNDPNDIAKSVVYKNLYQACGCHLSPNQYTKWNNLGVDGVNVSCDPLCMLPNVVPQFANGVQSKCSQNLCILDNISIDIINSQTGDINFNTLCGGSCSGGNCRCIFSNINVLQTGSTVGNINFTQSCGGNCSTPDPSSPGNFIQVDCKTGQPGGPPLPTSTFFQTITTWISDNKFLTLVIIIVIIAVILFIYYYLLSSDTPVQTGDKVTLNDLLGGFSDYYE
jgi:hypothetical protein